MKKYRIELISGLVIGLVIPALLQLTGLLIQPLLIFLLLPFTLLSFIGVINMIQYRQWRQGIVVLSILSLSVFAIASPTLFVLISPPLSIFYLIVLYTVLIVITVTDKELTMKIISQTLSAYFTSIFIIIIAYGSLPVYYLLGGRNFSLPLIYWLLLSLACIATIASVIKRPLRKLAIGLIVMLVVMLILVLIRGVRLKSLYGDRAAGTVFEAYGLSKLKLTM